ncbi:MAG TPA: HlyD family secretion protein [Bryobacteraceae bacterium]|nr:HlyD family secretion protein [Bryobacteraceae bacterium]
MSETLETQTPATSNPPSPTPAGAPAGATPEAAPPAPSAPPNPRKRRRAMLIMGLIGIVLLVGGFFYYRYAATYETTDDAIVDTHINSISSRISGTITAVNVDENQSVTAGEVLATIDPRDYQVATEQAQAQLKESQANIAAENPNVPITQTTNQANISTGQAQVDTQLAAAAAAAQDLAATRQRLAQSEAQVREAEANNAKAQADLARYRTLVEKDEIPKTQFDQIVAAAKAQSAGVDAAKATVAANQAQVESAARTVDQRQALVAEARTRLAQSNQNAPQQLAQSRANLQSKEAQANRAKASVDQALLNLSYTKIIAPVAGIIGKRSAEVGATVQAGQQLFTIAQTNDMWITANFKETQLRRMHPGLKVKIHIDAYDLDYNGYVESMPAASGSVTSLLPPENATGNFVKVVQRLPVRIRFDKDQSGLDRLRPGMSVEPKVYLQ